MNINEWAGLRVIFNKCQYLRNHIDECENPQQCNPPAFCSNLDGTFTCSCPGGFMEVAGDCVEIDDCQDVTCRQFEECLAGVCSCEAGYQRSISGLCRDQDECSDPFICAGSQNQMCVNNDGSFTCDCITGYTRNGAGLCVDMNECDTNPCGINEDCSNTIGSFTCDCMAGFRRQGSNCVALTTCATTTCDVMSQMCVEVPTVGAQCVCLDGFMSSLSINGCQDVDECLTRPCIGANTVCQNTAGSFECVCQDGFQANPSNVCQGTVCFQ
ncbi:hypothetical protein BSL78_10650 [Apostichopus japonicus]|uniref:EGF-like domain-containing protein n=1 Tax=Stichopus japonicus TaxID=307972 RepID=A0A2G8KWQ3_STIJA|nr:hypothetical protein BSL78_10650 [Apostichopus japonicus]